MAEAAATTTTTTAPWHQGVDAETLGFWQNKGYDLADPKTFATKITEQYRNAERHLGVPADQLLRLPKDATDQDGWKTVHQRLGVPKEAKDYDLAGIKFGDGTELEAGFVDGMRTALHQAAVSKDKAPEVVKAVIKYLDDADKAETDTRTTKLNEQKETLKKSWGPKHDENLLAAKQGARRLGVEPETVAELEKLVGYDKVMEMFRKVGAGTSEDTFHEGRTTGSPPTADSAKARLDELQNDAAWRTRLFAGDATANREFIALTEQIVGISAAAA